MMADQDDALDPGIAAGIARASSAIIAEWAA
jgi:hypothetical protein